ncbi:MAG: MlaD family protein [Candidatus Margulisbacteria bacterium]|nr:MlaD family protein [Candidatus Margulisiibacteriota bacterium]
MAMTPKAKVGIFALIALIMLASVIAWKTDLLRLGAGYQLTGSFVNVEGLTVGSEVRYRGLNVGKIMRIDPGPYDIKLYAVISKQIKFPADSQLRVSYDGIVGQKYLEIVPGTSEAVYLPGQMLFGQKTSGIVDFVDIGAKNLEELKKIVSSIASMVDSPKFRKAIMNTVYTADKVADQLEQLTIELRQTNEGIKNIVADPKFQTAVKGTMTETAKTLTSANNFFESFGKLNIRPSGGVDLGTRANAVIGDVDIVQNDQNYLRFGIGEGPTRQMSLLDILFNSKVADDWGFRLGVINNQLGGGIAYFMSQKTSLRGDIYDINNTRPNWPKVRLGYEHEVRDFMDVTVKADDVLNDGTRNFSVGIMVKPSKAEIY